MRKVPWKSPVLDSRPPALHLSLGFLVAALGAMVPTAGAAPALEAESYLQIESVQTPAEHPDSIDVTLLNVSERTITAWCLDVSGGGSDASAPFLESNREDVYAQIDPQDSNKPLRPGVSIVRRFSYSGLDLSAGRFEDGDYSVLSLRVGCVFLDNGESLGPNQSGIEKIQLRRLGEVRAAVRFQSDLRERIDDPLRAFAWFRELEASRTEADTRPVVMAYPSRAEILEFGEERSYKSLAYYTSSAALALHQDRGMTPLQVLEWIAADLERKTENGLRNLPKALLEEVR